MNYDVRLSPIQQKQITDPHRGQNLENNNLTSLSIFQNSQKNNKHNQNAKEEKTKLDTWRRDGENRYNDICIYAAIITISITFRKLSGNM